MKKKDKKRLSLWLISLSLMMSSVVSAQNVQITGTITDKSTGESIPAATVVEKGTTKGAISDSEGKFVISVTPGSVLVISFVGYTSQEVPIGDQTTVDVALETDLIALDEIVAIGYGTVRKKDLTGAVSSLSSDKLLQSPVSTLEAGMQGKIAGVTVQRTTGAPGQRMRLRVRGGSSINYSNEPLYVIDGFIGADITTIAPTDIATIDILKDASATAIYGSRGANGVVLITTNAPQVGKMKVSVDANIGMSNMVNDYELLSAVDMAELMNEQAVSKGQSPHFTADDIAGFRQNGGTDWRDLITQRGSRQNYTTSITGGTDKLNYFISGNFLDDQGTLKHSFYKRYSLRSNVSAKLSNWVDMKFNTFGTIAKSQNNGLQNNGVGNPYGRAVIYPQVWKSRDENGEYIDPKTYVGYRRWQAGRDPNPELFNEQNQESNNEKLTSTLDFNFRMGKHFTLLVSNSGSFSTGFSGGRDLINNVTVSRENMTSNQRYSRGKSFLNSNILSYQNSFNDHSIKVSAVYEFSKNFSQNNQAKVNDLSTISNEWYVLSNGSPSLTTSSYKESKMRSYMGRANYNYQDRFLVTAVCLKTSV